MKNVALIAFVVGAMLGLTPAAHAKGGVKLLAVCGASGCKAAHGAPALTGFSDVSTPFTAPSDYYVVRTNENLRTSADKGYWLPKGGWFAPAEWLGDCTDNPCWYRLAAADSALLHRQTRGLEPFSPELASATVGGRSATDPSAYLALLGKLHWALLPPEKLHLVRIVLRPSRPNPWIEGPSVLAYDPRHRILLRLDDHYRVPSALARNLFEHGSFSDGDGRAALYAGIGVSGAAALAVFALWRRRRT